MYYSRLVGSFFSKLKYWFENHPVCKSKTRKHLNHNSNPYLAFKLAFVCFKMSNWRRITS
jgi:hypothetical protein